MEKFTREELAQNNGKNQAPAFIGYKGKIFDVSKSFHWRNGKHQVTHRAGEDLTNALAQAPHSGDMLERFPVVGILKEN